MGLILPIEADGAEPAACPFCGSDHTRVQRANGGSYRVRITNATAVFCNKCGARGARCNSKAEAIVAWNERAA